jgi:hypothetical protein
MTNSASLALASMTVPMFDIVRNYTTVMAQYNACSLVDFFTI